MGPLHHAPPRLLVADDDQAVVSALAAHLGSEFDVVASAADAQEAIALAEEHSPDVAVVDVQMPRGGGLTAAKGISERSPGTAIVAFSADESRQGVLDMLDAGAVTYLRKNVEPEKLRATLHRAIAAHQASRSTGGS